MTLESQIEAILFYKNEPLKIGELSKLLGKSESEIKEAVQNLAQSLTGRGLCLIQTEKEVSLATARELTELIDKIAKDERSREIGKAGLETLAIILYNGPISRREIDYIRGVNSTFILRNLSIRGLVERESDSKDQRVFKYKGSLALLSHLGITKFADLPEFKDLQTKLAEKRIENDTESI